MTQLSPATDQGPDAFTSFRIKASDRAGRLARGRSYRASTPFESLGNWRLAEDRPSVLGAIQASQRGRLESLFGVRMGRMAASPFGFLRGSANLMAFDVAQLAATGIQTVCCGDAHIGNIGFYRSPEDNLVIDVNDFDEAHIGLWEWDLRRLTASIWVLGRVNGITEQQCRVAVEGCVRAYRNEVVFLSAQPLLWRAFDRLDVDALSESTTDKSLQEQIVRAAGAARKRTSDRKLPKIAGGAQQAAKIVDDPPLITHPDSMDAMDLAAGLDDYLPTLTPQWRRIVGGYSVVDIAHKVVGVGSVGQRAWIVLLVGSRPDDVLFLQLKQAQRSVLAPYIHGHTVWHRHQGQRVVEYQQQMQTVSDPLLGWTTVAGLQYYVRQWRNMKGGVPLDAMSATALADYSRIVGHLLAKGHARISGASVIAGFLGDSEEPVSAFTKWAKAYADQTERDHAELLRLIKAGQVPYEPGI